ncbi:FAD-dependent oxidoreductase [candidate division WWE3 bacterium]|nr:FAD-dependent oxidoreductase [candidate division WWE3 bacterium]
MSITMYGTSWCPDCQKTKTLLGGHKVDYKYVDIETDKDAEAKVRQLNKGKAVVPTLVFDDGSVLSDPTLAQIETCLKVSSEQKTHYCDLIVIGGGPSGLTAAIYTTREGIETEIFEKKAVGGQAAITDRIENYPGFPEGVSGLKLSEDMAKQAEEFGTKIRAGIDVYKIIDSGKYKTVVTSEGNFFASAILIAVGTDYKRLNVPGENENIGRGVHFCATCDGPFFKNKELIVVGGGNSAMQEGVFLTKFAAKITIVAWDKELTGSDFLKRIVLKEPKFEIHYNMNTTKVEKIENRMKLHATDRVTNESKEFTADGIFVFIGLKPNTEFLKNSQIELDERGFIKTDKTLQTSVRGVYAAGDCRSGSTLQIASAVGEGAVAALMIREYLKE